MHIPPLKIHSKRGIHVLVSMDNPSKSIEQITTISCIYLEWFDIWTVHELYILCIPKKKRLQQPKSSSFVPISICSSNNIWKRQLLHTHRQGISYPKRKWNYNVYPTGTSLEYHCKMKTARLNMYQAQGRCTWLTWKLELQEPEITFLIGLKEFYSKWYDKTRN